MLAYRETDAAPLLEVPEVKQHFNGVKALDGISMTVRSGHVHGLIGPNGSEKSTLVNVITGLYRPTKREVLMGGVSLPKGSLYRVARRGIAHNKKELKVLDRFMSRFQILKLSESFLIKFHPDSPT